MKDLNNKAVKVNSREEAREVVNWLKENTRYYIKSLNVEDFLNYFGKDSYIAINNDRIFIPPGENLFPEQEIISKKEFMDIPTESLEEKKLRLSRELKEVEDKIKEEQAIKLGDYVYCKMIGGNASNHPLYSSHKTLEEGDIFLVKYIEKFREHNVAIGDGYVARIGQYPEMFRKATKEEIASIPKEKEYTLKSGQKILIQKDSITYKSDTVEVSSVKRFLKTLAPEGEYEIGKLDAYSVTTKKLDIEFHVGCDAGVDISLKEMKEVVNIAESLK